MLTPPDGATGPRSATRHRTARPTGATPEGFPGSGQRGACFGGARRLALALVPLELLDAGAVRLGSFPSSPGERTRTPELSHGGLETRSEGLGQGLGGDHALQLWSSRPSREILEARV